MKLASLAMLAVLVVAPVSAAAFHPALSFEKTANEGGGGGLSFTGSPRHKGYDCAICHVDPALRITAEVTSDPAGLSAGSYTPGASYALVVRMVGEHRGFGTRANQNGIVLEVTDDLGRSAGTFVGFDSDEMTPIDDGRVLGGRAGPDTEWRFGWRAPIAGTGAVTLYLGVVDGDGAGNAAEAQTDPNGDDVAMVSLRACEGAAGCADRPRRAPDESIAAGCAAGGSGVGVPCVVLILCAVVTARRRRALMPPVLALAAASGCFDPTVPGECAGRVCGADTGDGGVPGCPESWECTSWEAPLGSDQATRTCIDANQVGTTECKPSEGPVTLPALDLEFYQCNVHPIIQRGCAMQGCHGTETGRPYRVYARGRLRNNEIVNRTGTCIPATGQVNLAEAGTGTVMCEGWLPHTPREWKKNFDSARSFMLDVAAPADSDMLLMPVVGGKPHIEVKLFRNTDADYRTIRDWLGGGSLQTCTTGVN